MFSSGGGSRRFFYGKGENERFSIFHKFFLKNL